MAGGGLEQADFALALLERVNGLLARSRDNLVMLSGKGVMERVAGFLLAIRNRLSVFEKLNEFIVLAISRRDITDDLAITVERVSREIGHLEGWLD